MYLNQFADVRVQLAEGFGDLFGNKTRAVQRSPRSQSVLESGSIRPAAWYMNSEYFGERTQRKVYEEMIMTFSKARRQPRLVRMAIGLMALLVSATISSIADTFPQQPGIKILHYTFDVTLTDTSDELNVKDTIDIQFLVAGVSGIDLNLCNLIHEPQAPDRLNPCLQPVPRARPGREAVPAAPAVPAPTSVGRGMTVTGVVANGSPLSFEHRNNVLHISVPAGYKIGDKFSLTVSYYGIPATGLFIGNNKYGDRVWFTDNWPNKAQNWLATIDHISVKAPKTIIVTAPRGYQVLSNGLKTEETDLPNGLRRTTWDETVPIPSWQYGLGVAAMAVEHFGRSNGTEFSVWAFPQDRDSAFKALDQKAASIFEFFSDRIGPFSYEKLAHLEAIGGAGAAEPATTIFYYNGSYGAESHEMAHQWFGDAVTERNWDDVWLAEGFATYFALLYTEHADGHDAFMAGVKRTRELALNYIVLHPADTVVHENLDTAANVFSNETQIYQGGAMVLHTLRGVLGDDVFWAGIRLYYSRYRNGSASTDDLRYAMEDACYAAGNCPEDHQDLSWFFHEWLNRGGILTVSGSWHYDATAKQLHVNADQTQSQGLYRMPIEIGIVEAPVSPAATAEGRTQLGRNKLERRPGEPQIQKAVILVDKAQNSLIIPLDAAPAAVQLDPGMWVPLMRATFEAN